MRFSFLLPVACVLLSCCLAAPPHNNNQLNVEESWEALKAGITQIYQKDSSLTIPQYMKLVGLVNTYCTKNSQNLSAGARGGAELVGHELYARLKDYLENYLAELFNSRSNLDSEELLTFYTEKWTEYRFSSRVLNGVFSYLNRHWVRREMTEGHKDVHEVYQLTLVKWREHILKHELNKKLTNSAIKLIERERNGGIVSASLISGFINCFTELGTNENGLDLSFYRENFEHVFIQDTERYYTAESSEYFQKNSITEYMQHVEKRFEEESHRVNLYLHPSTLPILTKTCERVLVEQHLDALRGEFQKLLDANQNEDLRRMHSLVSRISNGVTELQDKLEKHVHKEGLSMIAQIGKEAVADPELYVKTILEVHQKFSNLVRGSFKNEPGFVTALDKACIKFINDNEITKITKSPSKSPELLAKYCDSLLKKSSKNPEEENLNQILSDVIIVFNYINDKDVFQTYYRRLLAKRLINQVSISDEAEELMISKMKDTCGPEYTNKLQRMFQDIKLSRDLNDRYQQHQRDNGAKKAIDFNVQVLSTGSWPVSNSQSVDLKLPDELQDTAQRFNDFYGNVHSGRKLTWLYNMCKGEVVTTFLKNRYVLTVSIYQMAVLLQYNDHTSLTLEQLMTNTGIAQEYLVQVLQILLKAKLLICEDGEDNLTLGSVLKLNEGFKSKKARINLNVPLKIEEKNEQKAAQNQIDEERIILIQSTIVRIMKARKTLDHQNLIVEVISQLSSRFKPEVSVIKKQIEKLIEKEYIERKEGERDTYNYLA